MTLDQKIQVWIAVGAWVSGLGSFAAVTTALLLAKRNEKVRLKIYAGLTDVVLGDGSPFQKHLDIRVTNLGERDITINTVGWAVGKGKKRTLAMQTVSGPHTAQYPALLSYGKSIDFMVSFVQTPNWGKDFAIGFVKDLSDSNLKTLRVLVHTSVGQTIACKPDKNIIEMLKKQR